MCILCVCHIKYCSVSKLFSLTKNKAMSFYIKYMKPNSSDDKLCSFSSKIKNSFNLYLS